MKTKEGKAQEYAMRYFPPKENGDFNAALRHTLEEVYLAGYTEAMKWRDPEEDLPEKGIDVLLKCEKPFPPYYCYLVGKQCDGVFYSNETGYAAEKVIGWKTI